MAKQTSEEFLAHYGVKGMRWGKRKDHPRQVYSRDGTPIKVENSTGRLSANGRPVSDDAAKARTIQSVAKKRGTDALSNKELQDLVTRMNLEQQYDRLNPRQKNAGLEFAKKMVGQVAQREVSAVLTGGKGPVYKAVELALKR